MADSGTYDQATIARRQKIVEQMLADSKPPANMRSPVQGLAYLADTGANAFALNRLDKQAAEGRKTDTAALMGILGGDSATPAAASAAGTQLAPPSVPPSPVSGDPSLPRGIRNNNPLNIEAGDFTKGQPGFLGSDGRFARFETPEQGTDAAGKLLDVYANRHGLNTVNGIVNRWAPPSDNNPSQAYAASVAGRMGVGADDPLNMADPAIKQKIIAAMGQFENGRPIGPQASPTAPPSATVAQAMTPAGPPTPSGQPPAQPTAPLAGQNAPQGIPDQQKAAIARLMSATPGSPAYQLGLQLAGQALKPKDYGFQTLPDGTILRTDPHQGTVSPIYQSTKPTPMKIQTRDGAEAIVFVDPTTKKVYDAQGKEVETGGVGMGGTANPKGLSGPDYLASLPAGRKELISGMLEGRIAPAQLGRYGTKAVQSLIEDAAIVEPGFDMTQWGAREKGLKDFYGGGKSAETVRRLNQSALHFGDLTDKMSELPGSQVPLANKAVNTFNTQVLGKGAANNFEVNGHALADELAGLFKGAGISDTEIRAWESRLSPNMSEEQQRGMAKTLHGLYTDAMRALEEKRQSSLGPTLAAKHPPVLGQEATKALGRVEKFIGGQKLDAAVPAATEAAPKVRKYNPETGKIE